MSLRATATAATTRKTSDSARRNPAQSMPPRPIRLACRCRDALPCVSCMAETLLDGLLGALLAGVVS
jgi:hypothetical protein